MKLATLRIRNFRCFDQVEVAIGDMHAIVGANNAGKSTILRAIDLLLNPSTKKINEEAFCGRRTDRPIEIEGVFTHLTQDEATALSSYLGANGTFHLKRSIVLQGGEAHVRDGEDDGDGKVKIQTWYNSPQPKVEWLNPSKISLAAIKTWWAAKDSLVLNGKAFSELLGDKQPKVGEWRERAAEFTRIAAAESDFEDGWEQNPQGYANVLKATLPHFVLIPAVREASDESKVAKTNPFGRLIYEIVNNMEESFREGLATRLKETTRLLNREGREARAKSVVDVEASIGTFLAEVMPADLELEFQPPTLEVLLSTPRIFVDDGFRGAVDGKGHGLQRAVIFAILRAYAKLVTCKPEAHRRTLILGVEEPELYMHPTAQRTIRKVFRSIADGGDQVLFSTHSPLLVDVAYFDEIVRCENPEKRGEESPGRARVFQFPMLSMIVDLEARYPKLVGKVTSSSIRERYAHAYTPTRNEGFFAKRVILVEGATEAYAIPVYAAAMGHDLDAMSVAVVECGNKEGIDRLYRVFNELGIACYPVFDFDVDNKDADRQRESKALLALVGESEDSDAELVAVLARAAYFRHDWEHAMAKDVPDYEELVASARKALGIRSSGSKPLEARYIARRLTTCEPPCIPASVRKVLEGALRSERAGTCLRTQNSAVLELKPMTPVET